MLARKTSDVPTRIYSYRCLPPIAEASRVEDQFRLASQYRNALVEIERLLRGRLREVQLADPIVGEVLLRYEDADASVDAAYDDLRAAKSGVADPDLSAERLQLEHAKDLRGLFSNELREAKAERKEVLQPGYDAAREHAKIKHKKARGAFIDRGLRQGTYTRIEDAIKQAVKSTKKPLHFERYDGGGSIGTQITATSMGVRSAVDAEATALGMTVRELHSCRDPRFRLQALPADYWQLPRNRRRHAARVRAWLRVGSNPDRSPIFAEFPVTFHRPLPSDAVIKWAYVVRRRVGHHLEWRLQITIESETFRAPTQPVGEGTCAVDLGWRRILDDENNVIGLRAGYVVDERGREREIRVPDNMLSGMSKVTDLASIRDKEFETARDRLVAWLRDREVPTWMADRITGLAQWRAPRKLQAILDAWTGVDWGAWRSARAAGKRCNPSDFSSKANRIMGDGAILAALQAWARQDRHLQNWQEHQRERMIAQRREMWRVIGADLSNRYAKILIEDGANQSGSMRLPEIDGWEQPAPEDGDPSDGRDQRRMSRLAAPGELRAEIAKAAAKRGACVEVERAAYSTQECAWCGCDEPWDAKIAIKHACASCGRTWDQDANACRNLLHRHGLSSGPVPQSGSEVPAPRNITARRGISGAGETAVLNRVR